MKGTDCTESQIRNAREFLIARRKNSDGKMLDDEQPVELPFGQFAQLLAWYGAVRFQAGRDGTGGTLEDPGPITVRKAGAE